MNSIKLILTEAELATQQCPKPSSNVLKQAIDGSLTGIVTYIKLDCGVYQTISRYEDDLWLFPASKGSKNATKNELNYDFSAISDPQMRLMAKWVLWNKLKEGLALGSLRHCFMDLKVYFQWVDSSGISATHGLTAFTSNVYVKHVNACKIKRGGKIKPLAPTTKRKRFLALENLYLYCKEFDFVKEHPWVESCSGEQARDLGENLRESRKKSKTPIIPDEVLVSLCQFTKSYLDRVDELFALRDKLDAFVPTSTSSDKEWQISQKKKYLQSIEPKYKGLQEFNKDLILLRDSCIFWLLLTTGMRIHEILGIKRGAYRSETRDDMTYYYVESVSKKTYTGITEWIVPQIAIQAIDILGRYSLPFQKKLESDLIKAKANGNHMESHRLEEISNHILLSVDSNKGNAIIILSGHAISGTRLPALCNKINSNWNLSAHQFRRTFANYVVHSELGDLRSLKDHFKHWSISMTALYAFNDDLDAELFEELLQEKYLVEEEIKQDWFELDMPITGGAIAQKIMQIREDGELIKAFGSLSAMAKAFSSSIPIRSTGIGWCTNDDECKCGRPDSCESGIVDKRYAPYWTEMLIQQMKLMRLDIGDIGEAGIENVRKGMERCEKVLTALGFDVDAMKHEIYEKEQIEVLNV